MTEKLNAIVEQLKTLTLLEAADLVTEIEKVFGVDTTVSMAPGNWATPTAAVAVVEEVEQKTSFDIVLQEVPADKKIAILKVVRNFTGLGLKESKEIVDNVPKLLKEGVSKEEAEKVKKEIEEIGGKVAMN
jgi:large subunit ribosomal protein L7/L12